MEKELTATDRKEMKRAEEAHAYLSRYVNSLGNKPEMFAECVVCDHRTFQQNMGRLFFACIKRWAEEYDKGHYDLRNEETVKLCHDIMVEFEDRMFFPFV